MKRFRTVACAAVGTALLAAGLGTALRRPSVLYADAPGVKVWAATDFEKIRPTDTPRPTANDAAASGARNEVASFQAVVVADRVPLTVTDVRLPELAGPNGYRIRGESIALFREEIFKVTQASFIVPRKDELGDWPDAMVPIGEDRYFHERRLGTPFRVAAGRCQPIWADIRIPADAPAGDYTGTLTIAATGQPEARLPVRLHVWDFAIPVNASLPTSFGFGAGARIQHGLAGGEAEKLARLYVREGLANRISPWGLWYVSGIPFAEYDPAHPERGAAIRDWSRIDNLYSEAMTGTPEGRANTIDVPPPSVLASEIRAPVADAVAKPDSGLMAEGDYVYRVSAVNAAGETEGSKQIILHVPKNGSVLLNWSAVRNERFPSVSATAYNVYRAGPITGQQDEWDTWRVGSTVGVRYTDDGSREPSRANPCPFTNTTGNPEALAIYRAWADHFRKKGWLDRAYCYAIDEPFAKKKLAEGRKQALLWREANPGGWSLITNTFGKEFDGAVNLWCVVLNWFADPEHSTPADVAKHQAKGERVWWYQGMMSRAPGLDGRGRWPSFFIDDSAMSARVNGFYTWRYGFDGILYYLVDMAFNDAKNDPWTNQFYFMANGDGTLFYPGTMVRVGGTHPIPIASMRLKLFRQSMQDYEYLKLLADLGDRALADRAAARVVTAPDAFLDDNQAAALVALREEMARRIEVLMAKRR